MKSKSFFTIILFISIPFLIWYLYKLDLLSLQFEKLDYFLVIPSVLMLILGFVLSSFGWRYALKVHGIDISYRKAIVSHGLPVFAKYIPGKVWVILGRASYVATEKNPVTENSFISLKEQLVYLLLGLLISFPFLFFNYDDPYFPLIVGLATLGLGCFLLIRGIHKFCLRIANKLFKKNLEIPFISMKLLLKLSVVVVTYWIAWTLGFYLLLKSMPFETNFIMAFCFPVSVCMGLLAIVIPAGIGVREGIIVSFLTASGLKVEDAITFSLISRIWFVLGEVCIFLLALVLRIRHKNKS